MKDYDAYLFDWDGTLANSHGMWFKIMRNQLNRRDISISDEQIVRQLFGRYSEGMSELGVAQHELKDLIEELETQAKHNYPLVSLYPQAREVLDLLKSKGKKIALITATFREVIDIAVAHHSLIEVFDVIVAGNEAEAQKPHPSGLLIALEKLGVKPNKAVMMGDSPKDLLAGNNAGTDTLLFYPPEHETQHPLKELQKCNPTYTIRAWRELLDQLQ